MTPREIATSTAAALWNERSRLGVVVHRDETLIRGGRHANLQPAVDVTLPTGACVRIDESTDRMKACDLSVHAGRHVETFSSKADAAPIRIAWSAVQSEAILDHLGTTCPTPLRSGTRTQRALRMIGIGSRNREPDLERMPRMLSEAIASIILAKEPVRCDDTYIIDILGEGRRREVRTAPSGWFSIGSDILIQQGRYWSAQWMLDTTYMVSHPEWGVVRIPGIPISNALEMRRSTAFRNVLPDGGDLETPQPRISGSARLEAIRRLCSDALKEDPDMRDASGTPLAPLVDTHLPRLLANHAKASRNAVPLVATKLDDELTRGFEIVRAAFHEGLSRSGSDHRDAFRADLLFLETRHPGAIKENPPCP